MNIGTGLFFSFERYQLQGSCAPKLVKEVFELSLIFHEPDLPDLFSICRDFRSLPGGLDECGYAGCAEGVLVAPLFRSIHVDGGICAEVFSFLVLRPLLAVLSPVKCKSNNTRPRRPKSENVEEEIPWLAREKPFRQ